MTERWAVRRAVGRVVFCAPLLAVAGALLGELPGVLLALFAPVVGLVTVAGWRLAPWAGERQGRRLVLGLGLWLLAALGLVGTLVEALYALIMVLGLAKGRLAFDEAAVGLEEGVAQTPVVGLLVLLPAAVVSGGVAHGLPGVGRESLVARAPLVGFLALGVSLFTVAAVRGALTLESVAWTLGVGLFLVPLTVLGIEVGAFVLDKLFVQLDAFWLGLWPGPAPALEPDTPPLTSQARTPDKMSGPSGEATP